MPIDHDGCMNDTQETPRAQLIRTMSSTRSGCARSWTSKRSSDDRLLAGVCAGTARYLNIDPVIVRIVIAVLTFVGGAGVILYAAAWLLLPSDDAEKSLVARWFKLDKNEEQVRTIGLVGAGAVAVISAISSHGDIWWGFPWFILPLAALYYFFAVRPRQAERRAHEAGLETLADTAAQRTTSVPRSPPTSPPRSTARSPRRFVAPVNPSPRRWCC